MLIHNDTFFCIYFGDKKTAVTPEYMHMIVTSGEHTERTPFNNVVNALQLRRPIILNQVHGTTGYLINSEKIVDQLTNTIHEGDFLITTLPHIGIGVITADCLPLVMFDSKKNILGVAHAGWKGTLHGILQKMLFSFLELNTDINDLRIFYGPSAKVCCYEVQQDFISSIERIKYGSESLVYRGNKMYFDLPHFVTHRLISVGIPPESISMKYNMCTICDPTFCSVRREKNTPYRHITLATLRNNV